MSTPPTDETRDTAETRAHTPPPDDDGSTDDEPPVVYEFAIPAEELALANALREFPDIALEFEHLVPTNDSSMPFFWATDGKTPAFQRAVAADPHVAEVQQQATFDGGALYAVEWATDPDGLLNWTLNNHAKTAVLRAYGQADEWVLKFRFSSRRALSEFRAFCADQGVDVRTIRLYDLRSPQTGEYNVSEKQREALLRALEMGHFEIPREATLEEVASSLGISARALSERLRRGQTNLVGTTLTIGKPPGVGLADR